MNKHYDIIYISESGFQKKIVEHLITNIYPSKNYLWLQSKEGCFIDNENRTYNIDLNHVKGIVTSISSIFKFPKLSCDYLIGTQFTGVNCRFFEAVISYRELHLIDDGIGTPVILSNQNYYRHFPKELLKINIVSLLVFVTFFKKLKNTKGIIKNINKYYTIYPLNKSFKNEIQLDFLKYNYKIVDSVGFIGMPLVDYRMVTENHFTRVLEILIKEYKALDYYPDPNEKWIYNQSINGLRIIKKKEPLEMFLKSNGLPKKLYTFTSSALLNLKVADNRFDGYFIKIPNGGEIRSYYYTIFEKFGLKELNVDD